MAEVHGPRWTESSRVDVHQVVASLASVAASGACEFEAIQNSLISGVTDPDQCFSRSGVRAIQSAPRKSGASPEWGQQFVGNP